MKNTFVSIVLVFSSLAFCQMEEQFNCLNSGKIDTVQLYAALRNVKITDNNESQELLNQKKQYILAYATLTNCGSDYEESFGDVVRKVSIKGSDINVKKESLSSGFRIEYNIHPNGQIDTISKESEWIVIRLKEVSSPIENVGKFTDKSDAIKYARKLWKSGKDYSISVGNYCELSSNNQSAIYSCNEIPYRSKK